MEQENKQENRFEETMIESLAQQLTAYFDGLWQQEESE